MTSEQFFPRSLNEKTTKKKNDDKLAGKAKLKSNNHFLSWKLNSKFSNCQPGFLKVLVVHLQCAYPYLWLLLGKVGWNLHSFSSFTGCCCSYSIQEHHNWPCGNDWRSLGFVDCWTTFQNWAAGGQKVSRSRESSYDMCASTYYTQNPLHSCRK